MSTKEGDTVCLTEPSERQAFRKAGLSLQKRSEQLRNASTGEVLHKNGKIRKKGDQNKKTRVHGLHSTLYRYDK